MKNKAFDLSRHAFSAKDQILPDANVWLFLYSPTTIALPGWRTAQIAPYSATWGNLRASGASVYMDPLVFSEVINRLLDEEWLRIDPPDARTRARIYRSRKKFRVSSAYPPAAKSVEALGRQILADTQPLNHCFAKWDLNALLTAFGNGSTDWNDQLIVENCRHHGLKLLTDDADHTDGGIEVLTANTRLLAACPP